jgi:hypothetical protein
LEQIISLALAKDPARRPTAAAMGYDLDRWCSVHKHPGSPEVLQHHLAKLFPTAYQPLTDRASELTSFSNLKRSARRASFPPSQGGARRGLLARFFRN